MPEPPSREKLRPPRHEGATMTLTHPKTQDDRSGDLSVPPIFELEGGGRIPRHEIPAGGMPPDVAYQVIHDELMLDGNARLNLATFVTTWMEPHAALLLAECADKNMIDRDEYPRTAELERRCVRMLADLWHAPDPDTAPGCSTAGSSEAGMLAGLALKRRWPPAEAAAGPTSSWAATSRSAGTSSPTTSRSSRAWCHCRATGSTSTPSRRSRTSTPTPSASSPSSARPLTEATNPSPPSARPSTTS